jgi:hypothetical protein
VVSCETIRLSLRCPPTTIFLERLALAVGAPESPLLRIALGLRDGQQLARGMLLLPLT